MYIVETKKFIYQYRLYNYIVACQTSNEWICTTTECDLGVRGPSGHGAN